MKFKSAVLIVAGGKGLRMQTDIPKQFIELLGKPLLMHTIERFYNFDKQLKLIVVLPVDQFEYWNSLCVRHNFEIDYALVAGGETRFESVKNGLKCIDDAEIVAVHDGVRPLVSFDTLKRCFAEAITNGAAVPVTDSVESIRKLEGAQSVSVNRTDYKMVQTPQVFWSHFLLKAYNQEFSAEFTDDASVVEQYFRKESKCSCEQIALVEGNRENIKITTPYDLLVAEMLLKNGF